MYRTIIYILFILIVISCKREVVEPEPVTTYEVEVFMTRDGLPSNTINDVAIAPNNMKWFATDFGLSAFNDVAFINFSEADGLPHTDIKCVEVAQDGKVWIGTHFGAACYDGIEWTTFTKDDGLVSNYITDLYIDVNGIIWFATLEGASSFDGNNWTTYKKQGGDALVNDKVHAITLDQNGRVWFATEFGVSIYDFSTWTTYIDPNNSLAYNHCVHIDEYNRAWFGTIGGVLMFDTENWLSFNYDDGLPWNTIYNITSDTKGNIWYATQRGVSYYDGIEFVNLQEQQGIQDLWITDVEVDYTKIYWLGSKSGGVTKLSVSWADEK